MCPQVLDEINANRKKLWEVESSGVNVGKEELLTTEEKKAPSLVKKSMKFEDGTYEVEVPWKNGRSALPNNYRMALKRLTSTEMKLIRNPEKAKHYLETI